MASSQSPSPVSVSSANSTNDVREATSKRPSLEGLPAGSMLVPDEALTYTPSPSEILKPMPSGPPVRAIFGDLDLTPYELEALKPLRKAVAVDEELMKCEIFSDDRYALRFLQGNEWDVPRCIVDMKRHLRWRSENLPSTRAGVEKFLPRGFVYIHGRDHAFRPIFIIRCKHFTDSRVEDVMPVVVYWLEFTLGHLLVKNRVEQWRVIVDLEDCSISNTPIAILRQLCDTFTRNYRGRLCGMLILNAGFVFRSIWQLVSVVLPEKTKVKIKLNSSAKDEEFLQAINLNQVEERFGGLCPNMKTFLWPIMPRGPFTPPN